MKLLVITQKVDAKDSVLGFFHRWLEEFARRTDTLMVICLEQGVSLLPADVEVFSLGKEEGRGRFHYITKFFTLIWTKRHDYDAVLVHMNPIYVVLAGWLWRLQGKKIGLWYTHKHVDWKLRIAEYFAHVVLTASEKSFRLKSKKLHVMGHGIDTSAFAPRVPKIPSATFRVITVGRLSLVKNLETLIDAIQILKNDNHHVSLQIVGGAETQDQVEYEHMLKDRVRTLHLEEEVVFTGALSQTETIPRLEQSDLMVNTSKTGSLDKAVLEAMACGVPVLTSNEAFSEMLKKFDLMFEAGNFRELAYMIEQLAKQPAHRAELGLKLRREVVEHHELGSLIERILHIYETSR